MDQLQGNRVLSASFLLIMVLFQLMDFFVFGNSSLLCTFHSRSLGYLYYSNIQGRLVCKQTQSAFIIPASIGNQSHDLLTVKSGHFYIHTGRVCCTALIPDSYSIYWGLIYSHDNICLLATLWKNKQSSIFIVVMQFKKKKKLKKYLDSVESVWKRIKS